MHPTKTTGGKGEVSPKRVDSSYFNSGISRVSCLKNKTKVVKEERMVLLLLQTQQIRGHLLQVCLNG